MADGFTARDVLNQLDDDARRSDFCDFDHGYGYHVDARLSAYADASRWAIVIEHLHVNPRWASFAGAGVQIFFHGNCISVDKKKLGGGDNWYGVHDILANAPSGPILPDDAYSEEIILTAKEVLVRGKAIEIRTDENYYWGRNIDTARVTNKEIDDFIAAAETIDDPETRQEMIKQYEGMRKDADKFAIMTWNLLRGMVPDHRDELLATEGERRVGLPRDLPLILQVSNWDHPKLVEGEMPGSCEAFRQIARVLEKRDAKLWTFDEDEGNVHWRNWPESGNL